MVAGGGRERLARRPLGARVLPLGRWLLVCGQLLPIRAQALGHLLGLLPQQIRRRCEVCSLSSTGSVSCCRLLLPCLWGGQSWLGIERRQRRGLHRRGGHLPG